MKLNHYDVIIVLQLFQFCWFSHCIARDTLPLQ